jgi:hypothetical protein
MQHNASKLLQRPALGLGNQPVGGDVKKVLLLQGI